jgi:hypothetical protein
LFSSDNLALKSFKSMVGLFPLTVQGTFTLLVAAGALNFFAYGSLDLIVFALAICTLAILVFCLFNTVIVGVLMQRKIRKLIANQSAITQRMEVEAGYPNETGFVLPALSFLPLVRLSWKVIHPDAIVTRVRTLGNGDLREEIIPHQRCLSNKITRQFSVSDVLGFCRFSWTQRQDASIRALPQINSVKQLPILRSLTAEDGIPSPSGDPEGDRMEIRPYAPGDSVKNILWKVFARNRQLNVRLPENSVFQSNRTIAYLLSSNADEAAAAVARIALQSGALGDDWSFGADGTSEPCNTVDQALDAVARSRAIDGSHEYGLDRFLQAEGARSGTHCVVFAAAADAPWLAALKSTVAQYGGQFSLVLATDGLEREQQQNRWKQLFIRDVAAESMSRTELGSYSKAQQLLTEIGQLVESTLIVDRRSGLSFDQHLRKV